MTKLIAYNKIYDKSGTMVAENVHDEEFKCSIQCLSIINVCNIKSAISGGIAFFQWLKSKFRKMIMSTHSQIYMGVGRSLCASADLAGFMLRRLVRQMKPGINLRVYSNWKMSVQDMEIIKGRIYDRLDEPYSLANVLGKAKIAVREAWEALTNKPVEQNDSNVQRGEQVCNEQVVLCFMAMDSLGNMSTSAFYRIVAENISLDESSPSNIDDYMETAQAKEEGWYLAAEYYWLPA